MSKKTEELLDILKSKKTYTEYKNDSDFELIENSVADYLQQILDKKGLKKNEVIEKSNLDKTYAYQIFNGTKKNPSRDKILMLSFALCLNEEETRRLLKLLSLADLYVKNGRDSVILFALSKKMTILDTNELLYENNYDILK